MITDQAETTAQITDRAKTTALEGTGLQTAHNGTDQTAVQDGTGQTAAQNQGQHQLTEEATEENLQPHNDKYHLI